VTGTVSTAPPFRSFGLRINGTGNRITDNHVVGSGATNDTGVYGAASTACFDNYIRAALATQGCDATLGNL